MGVAMLTLGRKLFWIFVGGVGFVIGAHLAAQYLHGQPEWMVIIIALFGGVLGSLIALAVQNVAIVLAGFIAGGFFVVSFFDVFGWQYGELGWIYFVVGGVFGALLVALVFDWALIILSSITGATLITQTLPVSDPVAALVLAALITLGIFVQASLLPGEAFRRTSRTSHTKTGTDGQVKS